MPCFQVAEPVQQIGHPQRHRGLTGARIAGEAHVQVRPGRFQAEPLPHPVDQQERGDLLDLLLHRNQPDQLIVQGGEHLVDARRPPLLGKGHRGVRAQRLGAPPAPGVRRPAGLAGLPHPCRHDPCRRDRWRGTIRLASLPPGIHAEQDPRGYEDHGHGNYQEQGKRDEPGNRQGSRGNQQEQDYLEMPHRPPSEYRNRA